VGEHARVIAESLWNLDREGPVEYLKAVAAQIGYDHLVVTEPDGGTFIEIDPEQPGRLEQALIHMKLIPRVPISTDITHDGDIIGAISVVWHCRAIYPYTYFLLVTGLILAVILLYNRISSEKYKLAAQVENRTEELRRAMEDLQESESNFRLLAEASPVAISIYRNRHFLYVNTSWEVLLGYTREEAQDLDPFDTIHPEMREEALKNAENRLIGKQAPKRYEMKFIHKKGDTIWCDFSVTLFNYGNEPAALCVTPNITDRKAAEKEREDLIQKLQKALDEIKTLRGIIPVCSSCKSIRDDKGLWNEMEKYIIEHSDAKFSHGICPDCAKKLYPWFKSTDDEKNS
jgi:PAS domain S-box-containing protein